MKCSNPYRKCVDKGDAFSIPPIPAKFVEFPCGKCLACRINRTREWSLRLYHESLYSESCIFVTLTYNEEHLPRDDNDNPSVSYDDVRHFLARLRKKYHFRYFINSEYGPETSRPHYHGILFFDDKKAADDFKNGERIVRKSKGKYIVSWHSPLLEDFWQNGDCEIGDVLPARCTYTAKYFVNRSACDSVLTPNFSIMSRRPGIGTLFIDEHSEMLHEYSRTSMQTSTGTFVKMPRFYKGKVFSDEERKDLYQKFIETHQVFDWIDPSVDSIRQKMRNFTHKKSKL